MGGPGRSSGKLAAADGSPWVEVPVLCFASLRPFGGSSAFARFDHPSVRARLGRVVARRRMVGFEGRGALYPTVVGCDQGLNRAHLPMLRTSESLTARRSRGGPRENPEDAHRSLFLKERGDPAGPPTVLAGAHQDPSRSIRGPVAQHREQDARQLAGHRHHGDLSSAAGLERHGPGPQSQGLRALEP